MKVVKVEKYAWKSMSEEAHRICFSEVKPVGRERVDFALLVTNDDDFPLGYTTCKELDSETIYLQFGGCFPGTKDSVLAFKSYVAGIEFLKKDYKNVCFYVKNDNFAMLKFAMKTGFKIIGVKNRNGDILLEHVNGN